jgi:hypothetical protein
LSLQSNDISKQLPALNSAHRRGNAAHAGIVIALSIWIPDGKAYRRDVVVNRFEICRCGYICPPRPLGTLIQATLVGQHVLLQSV